MDRRNEGSYWNHQQLHRLILCPAATINQDRINFLEITHEEKEGENENNTASVIKVRDT